MTEQSTELVQTRIMNPLTGEIVDLALGTDHLARARRDVVDAKSDLDVFAGSIDEELTRRLDAANTRSATVGDGMDDSIEWEITGRAPTVENWPVELLAAALDRLIEAGKLDASVRDKVLVPQERPPAPPPKVAKREINKLVRHIDPEVREAILACRQENPQNRTVSVKQLVKQIPRAA